MSMNEDGPLCAYCLSLADRPNVCIEVYGYDDVKRRLKDQSAVSLAAAAYAYEPYKITIDGVDMGFCRAVTYVRGSALCAYHLDVRM